MDDNKRVTLAGNTRPEAARENATRESRLVTAESLNQSLRRLRQAASQAEGLGILLDSAGAYTRVAVVLRVENNQARSAGFT